MKKYKSHSMDMLSGSLAKKMLLFAFPLMASRLLQLLFKTADVVVIGRYAGTEALAAVGSCGYLIDLVVGFFGGFALGVDLLMAHALGTRDHEEAQKAVHSSLTLSALFGVVMAVFGVVFAPQLLGLMKVPDDVIDQAAIYLRIYFLGAPGIMIFNCGASLLRAQGDTQRSLLFLSVAGGLNLVLNLIFVVFFHMDTAGVALATALSQYAAMIPVLICLRLEPGALHLDFRKLGMDKQCVISILKVGFPSALENSMYGIGNATLQATVNSFGSTVIAAGSAADSLENILHVPYGCITSAVLTFSSQNYSARKFDRVDKIFRLGLLYGCSFTIFVTTIATLLGRPLLGIIVPGEEAVIQEGLIRLRCIWPLLFLASTNATLSNILRGIGHPVIPMVVSIASTCGLRLLWAAYVVPWVGTTASLYIVWPVSWVAMILVLSVIYHRLRKRLYISAPTSF